MREEYEQSDAFQEFHHILWWMFQDAEGPRHQVKVVAPELDINLDTLYKYIRGSLAFPAFLLPGLYRATREPKLLSWLARNCSLTITPLNSDHHIDGDVTDNLDEVMIASFNLFEAKVAAFKDGALDETEKADLYAHGLNLVNTIQGMLAELSAGKGATAWETTSEVLSPHSDVKP